jgi:hypothetical protein
MTNLNLSDRILPGISAGGYTIGSTLSSYEELSNAIKIDASQKSIGQILSDSQGWMFYEQRSRDGDTLRSSSYYYKDEIIRLVFSENQVLQAIYLSDGYKGEAFDSIKIHSSLSELKKVFDVKYDDCEETYLPGDSSGILGIEFCVTEDTIDESIQDGEILMICIYNWNL